jgi:iron complex outermembrane receptor protein
MKKVALIWLVVGLPGIGVAGLGEAKAETADLGDGSNSEIIVTSQRRSEKLVEVPASIVTVSSQTLEASGVENLQQIGGLVPGLVISPPVGLNTAAYIRGVGADSRNIGFDSRVGIYVDGVYAGQSPSIGQSLVDVERVEVLRGPQGTLFGKNSIAGAINIITRAPSAELEGTLNLRGGNRDSGWITGSVNLPLSGGISARVAASRIRRDGWATNLHDGSRLGNTADDAQRAQIKIEPSEGLAATMSIDHLNSRSHVFVADNLTDTFATTKDLAAPGRRQVMFSRTPEEERRIFGISFVVRYRQSDGSELVSTSSYRRTKYKIAFDEDWSSARFFEVDYFDRYSEFSQEIQLISPSDRPINYIVGAIYQHQKNFTDRQVVAGADISVLPFNLLSGARVANMGTVRADNLAAYFNVTVQLGSGLDAGFGARYSIDRKRVDWRTHGAEMPAFNLATGSLVDRAVDHDFSPSLTLSYRIASSVKFYLRYAEGYKSGGFNLDFVSADLFPNRLHFAKETVRSHEAGLKADLQRIPLTLGLAAFWSRYSDYQVNQFQDLGGGRTAIVIANAASVRTRGVEVDMAAKPLRGLSASVSASVLDARFRRFSGGGVAGSDVSGNRLPYASKFQASLSVDYANNNSSAAIHPFAHADLSYRSGFFTSVDNVRSQPLLAGGSVRFGHGSGYMVVNTALGVEWAKPRIRLAIWARNLSDQNYTSWMYRDFFGTLLEVTGEPRTYGLEIRWRF